MTATYIWSEVVLSILFILGMISNSYVIYDVFYKKKTSLRSETVLIGIITTSDLVACLVTGISQSLRVSGVVRDVSAWCWSDLLMSSTSTFATLSITSMLSVVRYLSLVQRRTISWQKCLMSAIFLLSLVWIVIIGRGSLNGLEVMPSELYCMPHTEITTSCQWVLEILYVVLMLPCPFVISVCYIAVAFRYKRLVKTSATAAVQSTCSELRNSPTIQNQIRDSFLCFHWRRLVKLALFIFSHSISLAPEYILSCREFFFHIPRNEVQDTIAFLAMFLLGVINLIFVLDLRQVPCPIEELDLSGSSQIHKHGY